MPTAVRCLWVLLFVVNTGARLLAADGAIEAEVRQLDAARIEALQRADVPALERLLSDRLVYIPSDGRIGTKDGYLAIVAQGDLAHLSIKYDLPVQVRVVGDTAIVTGRANIDAKTRDGQAVKRTLTTSTVYVRTPKGWSVVLYQGTPAT